jgi:hypothetical protein
MLVPPAMSSDWRRGLPARALRRCVYSRSTARSGSHNRRIGQWERAQLDFALGRASRHDVCAKRVVRDSGISIDAHLYPIRKDGRGMTGATAIGDWMR